jgi:hypothetical protein
MERSNKKERSLCPTKFLVADVDKKKKVNGEHISK